jgi:hypothetical protein
MISIARLFRYGSARTVALLAMLVFGWQGVVQGTIAASLPAPVFARAPTTIAREDLRPAHTILPAVPAEVAKPASQQQRPYASIAAPAPSAETPAPPSYRFLAIADDPGARPADQSLPPYSARGPPLLS